MTYTLEVRGVMFSLGLVLGCGGGGSDDAAPSSDTELDGGSDSDSGLESTASGGIDPNPTAPTAVDSGSDSGDSTDSDPGQCGDGIVDPGEQCDDANDEPGDGCENDCQLTPSGLLWSVRNDRPLVGIEVASDGAVVVAASLYVDGVQQAYLGKYSPAGDLQWELQHVLLEGYNAGVRSLALDPDDNIVVSGDLETPAGEEDVVVAKFDPDGQPQWVEQFAGPAGAGDYAARVATDDEGAVYVGGTANLDVLYSIPGDALALKFDPDGTLLWSYVSGDSRDERIVGLATDGAQVILAGRVRGAEPGAPYRRIVIGLDDAGTEQWVDESDNPTGTALGSSAAIDASGTSYVVGTMPQGSASAMWLNSYTPDGAPALDEPVPTSIPTPTAGVDVTIASEDHIAIVHRAPDYTSIGLTVLDIGVQPPVSTWEETILPQEEDWVRARGLAAGQNRLYVIGVESIDVNAPPNVGWIRAYAWP